MSSLTWTDANGVSASFQASTSPLGAPLDWKWLRGAKSEWGVRPKIGPRGLTMLDIAVNSYGEVPDHPTHRSMAPRGADGLLCAVAAHAAARLPLFKPAPHGVIDADLDFPRR